MMNDIHKHGTLRDGKPVSAFFVSILLHVIALFIIYPFATIRMSGNMPRGITVFLTSKVAGEGGILQEKKRGEQGVKRELRHDRSSKKISRPVREVIPEAPVKAESKVTEIDRREEAKPVGSGDETIRQDSVDEMQYENSESDGGGTGGVQSGETAGGEETVYGLDRPYEAMFGEGDGPRFLKRVQPLYPLMARRLGKEGRVLLSLLIDGTGKLMNVEVVERAGFGFEGAAIDAVRHSSFRPAVINGVNVASRSLLSVKFVLKNE